MPSSTPSPVGASGNAAPSAGEEEAEDDDDDEDNDEWELADPTLPECGFDAVDSLRSTASKNFRR